MSSHVSHRVLVVVVWLFVGLCRAESANRVTILYDSFGNNPAVSLDWGFAALVDYGGKHILFDTGNNAKIFERNVKALGVDLNKIDFAIISHRHADHTSGLNYLLKVNPKVKIYVPDEPLSVRPRSNKHFLP